MLDACACLGPWFAEIDAAAVALRCTEPRMRFAELPLQQQAFEQLAGRLKAPAKFLQAALDVLTWGRAVGAWQSAGAEALHAAFDGLQVTHGLARLSWLIEFLNLRGNPDCAPLIEVAKGWRGVKLSRNRARELQGRAYGEALAAARLDWLRDALKD